MTPFEGETSGRRDRRSCSSSYVPVVCPAHGGSCHSGQPARLGASDPLGGEGEQCGSPLDASPHGTTHSCRGSGAQWDPPH